MNTPLIYDPSSVQTAAPLQSDAATINDVLSQLDGTPEIMPAEEQPLPIQQQQQQPIIQYVTQEKTTYEVPMTKTLVAIGIMVIVFVLVTLLPVEDVVYTYVHIAKNKLLDTAVKALALGGLMYVLRNQLFVH